MQLKPAVIHRDVEVISPAEYFSSSSKTDTPWRTEIIPKIPYWPSSRVFPNPNTDEHKNRIELIKDVNVTIIIVKSKSIVAAQPEPVLTPSVVPGTEVMSALLPAEHYKEISNEHTLTGEGSCCDNCLIS